MGTVFVTGATGVLGKGAVAELVASGHSVRGLARNAERAGAVAATGAEPIVADLYDVDDMKRAVADCDTVMHLATRIPPIMQARRASAWEENSRLREEGTRVLVDAALANGVRHFVAESITFIYTDGGSNWLDERSPVDAGVGLQPVLTLEHEVARFTEAGGIGIALRFGAFYGADARGTEEFLTAAKRRIAPAAGPAAGFVSSIETGDAGRAAAAALAVPAGVYNVVDDVPLTRRELADAFAAAFGLHRLHITPAIALRLAGGAAAQALTRSQRVSNAAFKAASGWTPKHTSAVEGWKAVAASRGVSNG